MGNSIEFSVLNLRATDVGKNQVTSGIRDFGETIIYLYQIKGTTDTIKMKPSLRGKVRPIINNL